MINQETAFDMELDLAIAERTKSPVYVKEIQDGEHTIKTDDKGNVFCFLGDVLDSKNDEPAIIYSTNQKFWYRNGQLHRDNGPIMIHSDSSGYVYAHYYLDGVIYSSEETWKAELKKCGKIV